MPGVEPLWFDAPRRHPGSASTLQVERDEGAQRASFGTVSLVAASGWLQVLPFRGMVWPVASIMFVTAAVPVALGALVRGDRTWPAWTGLALGAAPALLWLAFLVANLVVG